MVRVAGNWEEHLWLAATTKVSMMMTNCKGQHSFSRLKLWSSQHNGTAAFELALTDVHWKRHPEDQWLQTKYDDDYQSLKLALRQPCVWSVSDFSFLATAYKGGWPVLSLTVSSSLWQCVVSVLIIGELARGRRLNVYLEPNFCPGRGLNLEPHDWHSSTLTTRLPHVLFTAKKFRKHFGLINNN